MTELAYLADSDAGYVLSFRATITALPPGGVVLDRTFFYPTGGGQPCDLGSLESDGVVWPVADVTKVGSGVVHRLGRPATRAGGTLPLRVGSEVAGSVDAPRREAHRRAHSAQHLLSARVFARAGLRTRAASIRAGGGRLDLEGGWPGVFSLAEMEADVNLYRARPVAVRIRHVARADWERNPDPRSGLVPLPIHVDPVRLIELDGIDRCPCGGTHVRSTAEFGAIHLAMRAARDAASARIDFTLAEVAPPTPSG